MIVGEQATKACGNIRQAYDLLDLHQGLAQHCGHR
jgi:hypothetical protein